MTRSPSAPLSRLLRAAAVVTLTLAVTACSNGDPDKGRLNALARATLTPGEGLGTLRLGDTTFKSFADKYGVGHPAIVLSDVDSISGFELSYRNGQMVFFFAAEGEAKRRFEAEGPSLGPMIVKAPKTIFTRYPEFASMPLDSIAVKAASTERDTFYKGKTPFGLGLFDEWPTERRRSKLKGEDREAAREKDRAEELKLRNASLYVAGSSSVSPTAPINKKPGIWVYGNPGNANTEQMEMRNIKYDVRVDRLVIHRPKTAKEAARESETL